MAPAGLIQRRPIQTPANSVPIPKRTGQQSHRPFVGAEREQGKAFERQPAERSALIEP